MSENPNLQGSYANRSRGPPNRPVVEPSSSLTEPSSNAQPEPSSDAQPEPNAHLADHFRDVIDIFVNRFKQGYWNPNLTDDEEEIPKRRALVIAMNYEGGENTIGILRGAYTDASNIISVLETKLGYASEDICVLADIREPFSEEQGRSRWPSKENICEAMRWLTNRTTSGHYRFLFVAGHGHRQIRAQEVDGSRNLISNEGIMLREHSFIPFDMCDNCQCQDRERFHETYQETWGPEDGPKYIPQPQKVLYDYELNEWLAQSLGPGAKLTAVFDCCYSGGTLNKTMYRSTDVTKQARGGSTLDFNKPLRINRLPDLGQVSKPFGNILCLPKEAVIGKLAVRNSANMAVVSTPEVESVSIKSCLSLPSVPAGRYEFHETCEVTCWAACREHERSYGDEYTAENSGLGYSGSGIGYFSMVFAETFKSSELPTYRELNGYIQARFKERNKDMSYWHKQRPKLFVSNNLAKDEHSLASYFDTKVNM